MDDLHQSDTDVSPAMQAGLILAAASLLRHLGLPRPTVSHVLEATSARRSRAYELRAEIFRSLPTLERPVGRPRSEQPPAAPAPSSVTDQVLSFVMQHPGCVHGGAQRRCYSDVFRCFVLDLCEQNHEDSLETFAQAAHVPLGTLKDWLRGGNKDVDVTISSATTAKTDPVATGRIETLIEQWRAWRGTFSSFCKHVSYNLRIPFGRTLISSILEQHGERAPHKRTGRSPDEKALRRAFETFFAGAQWEGDGSPIVVQIGDQRFRFNLELMVDAHSDAAVGVSFRDEEDSEAVVEAFNDGVSTTETPPLAVLLDNRPSNHTETVDYALDSTLRIRATTGRPQNKAHVEGAFGLFAQVVPLIAITATSPIEVARQVLQLVVQTWGRTLNHKPMKKHKGRSRVDLYTAEQPTADQVEHARDSLEQRLKKQQKARETLKARQDPVVRAILDDAFARLDLDDPEGNIRSAIARYPLDHVVNGIATFEGKRHAGTLPAGVHACYLFGIVKNICQKDEGLKITEQLLRARLDARDRLLSPLRSALEQVLQLHTAPSSCLRHLIDLALKANRNIDRLFWLGAVADHILDQPPSLHANLLRFCSQRIHATFAIHYKHRQIAVRFLCTRVTSLEKTGY